MSLALSPAEWADALSAVVQARLERAVLGLSRQVPALLDDAGPKFMVLHLTVQLPAGEALKFTASLEVVE